MQNLSASLRFGDWGSAVAELRKILISQNLLTPESGSLINQQTGEIIDAEEFFDKKVELAVRAFQQIRGLVVDGIVGQTTYQALQEATHQLGVRELYYNDTQPIKGDDVASLQARLHKLGFYSETIDGTFSRSTHDALISYQKEFGLNADGVCGTGTLRSLKFLGLDIGSGSANVINEYEKTRDLGPLLRGKRVVVDPGLGGSSIGSIISTNEGPSSEADLLWDLAVITGKKLSSAGVDVIFSRSEGSCPSDQERAQLANAQQANMLISLRFAHYKNSRANGVSCFYFGNSHGSFSPMSKRLAGFINREVAARVPLQDCRHHERTWDLLKLTKMPSVVVDIAYASSPSDMQTIGDKLVREMIAESIVVSIKRLYMLGNNDQPTGTFSVDELIANEADLPWIN